MPQLFLFTSGPKGRGINVDADGRLVLNSDPGASPFVFTYGDTGRAITVDPSGRLLVNLSLIANEWQSLTSATGITPDLTGGNNFYLPIEHNVTLSPTVPGANGAKYLFLIHQVASGGGKTLTVNNTIWAGGNSPSLTAASGSKDVVVLSYVPQIETYIGEFVADWKA